MSIKAVVQFLEKTSSEDALREDVATLLGIGDGDVSSAAEIDQEEAEALSGGRGVLVAAFAGQKGYAFSVAELNAVVGVFQRYKAGELSEAEFSSALGLEEAAPPIEAVGKSVGMVYRGIPYPGTRRAPASVPVLEFMKATAEDDELRNELQAILHAGDGDISDFSELDDDEVQALKSGRGALVAEFAASKGFTFTMADLFAVVDAFQRLRAGELTEEAFMKFLQLDVKSKDFFPFIETVTGMTFLGVRHNKAIAAATPDNTLPVVRFMEQTQSDAELRQKLQAVIGGDGDISDPGKLDAEEKSGLSGDRSQQIVDLGAEYGFRFTVADLTAVVEAFELVNAGKLDMDDCKRILGLGGSVPAEGDVQSTAGRIYRGVRY